MPVIKSAKKKLKQDKKRAIQNSKMRALLKDTLKKTTKNPSEKLVKQVTKIADKAAKMRIIHKNKSARIKSTFAHLLHKKTAVK